MRWITALAVSGAIALAAPAAAQDSGAWTTLLRAFRYNDLLPDGDTVWCATQDAGLLRYHTTTATFSATQRTPGGLASNHLSAVALDARRQLWVGTNAGVSVLDAARSRWMLVDEFGGLPSNTVTVLEADGDTMWIGTDGGIALWNGHEISGRLPDGSGASPFASNVMRGVAVIDDTVWVATANGAYRSLISGGLIEWTAMNAGLNTRDLGGLAERNGVLITVDSLRAYRFHPGTSSWVGTPDIGAVRYVADDPGGIVAASVRGIWYWDGFGWTRVTSALSSPGQSRRDFVATRDLAGRFYAANQNGVYAQPPGGGADWPVAFPVGPPGNNVLNVELDGDRLYMTTTDEGFGRLDGSGWKYWFGGVHSVDDTTQFRSAAYGFALLADRSSRKWVGCWDGALESFDDSVEPPIFKHWWTSPTFCTPVCDDTTDAHTFAWTAVADSVGGRWFAMEVPGTHDVLPLGLDYYDPAGNYAATYRPGTSGIRNGKVHGLTVDRNGRIWVGYPGQGIDFFDWPPRTGTRPQVQTAVAAGNVQGLVAGPDAIWALTTDGLLRLSFSGDVEASYDLVAEPTDPAVHAIDIAPDGSVWVGTALGIQVFERNGLRAEYTTENSPLAGDAVRAIRINRRTGVVWIGTAEGLSRFDPHYVPVVPEQPQLEITVFPNPARITELGTGVRLTGNAAEFVGEVYDLTGRILHRFRVASGQPAWNGLGPDGRPVKPGIYWIRAESGGRSSARRVVLVR